MGDIVSQKPVKLFASIIYKEEGSLLSAEKRLKKMYGDLEPLEKILPFDYTDYYYEEFGNPLMRKLICFRALINLDDIPKVKITTNNIEDNNRIGSKRTVNIDPGYVTEAKLVLLTTKDYSHRIYVGQNMFAEVTLYFQNNTFNPWPWTYPDYSSGPMISYFNSVRERYMEDVKGQKTVKCQRVKGSKGQGQADWRIEERNRDA